MKYTAPQTDMRFVLFDVLDATSIYSQLPGGEDVTRELVEAILEEGAKFCEQVLAPTNAIGDEEGCVYEKSSKMVNTPAALSATAGAP